MEITKKFLQARLAGLQEQLGGFLGQVATVQGAIDNCELLVRFLDAPYPEPPKPSDLPADPNLAKPPESASPDSGKEETTPAVEAN